MESLIVLIAVTAGTLERDVCRLQKRENDMLYDRLKKAYLASTLIAGLMALTLAGTVTIIPISSAHAQTSTYQTARHVFPWAQQQRPDYTPGYYSDNSNYFYDYREQDRRQ